MRDFKQIEAECQICKSKFTIWISSEEFSEEMAEKIKGQLYRNCPVCKAFEEMQKKVR